MVFLLVEPAYEVCEEYEHAWHFFETFGCIFGLWVSRLWHSVDLQIDTNFSQKHALYRVRIVVRSDICNEHNRCCNILDICSSLLGSLVKYRIKLLMPTCNTNSFPLLRLGSGRAVHYTCGLSLLRLSNHSESMKTSRSYIFLKSMS
jgi:hypothetical protein